jgi:hypothetical protein
MLCCVSATVRLGSCRRAFYLVIKMNTGGGKTIVGLLIARSCLNEEAGPVAFLVPDNYPSTMSAMRPGVWGSTPRPTLGHSHTQVAARSWSSCFRGYSTASPCSGSVEAQGVPRPIRTWDPIIDDAHTCLAKAEQEFRLTVPSSEAAYGKILELFADVASSPPPGSWTYVPSGSGLCGRSRSGRGLTANARRPAPARRPGAIHVLLAAAG